MENNNGAALLKCKKELTLVLMKLAVAEKLANSYKIQLTSLRAGKSDATTQTCAEDTLNAEDVCGSTYFLFIAVTSRWVGVVCFYD